MKYPHGRSLNSKSPGRTKLQLVSWQLCVMVLWTGDNPWSPDPIGNTSAFIWWFQTLCFSMFHHTWDDPNWEIPSGISVLLDIGGHRLNVEAATGSADTPDHVTFMQTSSVAGRPLVRRWQARAAVDPSSLPPQVEPEHESHTTGLPDSHCVAPDSVPAASPHGHALPSQGLSPVQVHDQMTFRQSLQWQITTRNEDVSAICADLAIMTWFLDSQRFTRADHPRHVMLRSHPMHWVQDIIDRWTDWILVEFPVQLHLVQPQPPEGTNLIILVQRQELHTRAALISVVEMLDDPWNPVQFSSFCLLKSRTSNWWDEATVSSPFLPLGTVSGGEVTHGNVDIPPQADFPVRDGFSFSSDCCILGSSLAWQHCLFAAWISQSTYPHPGGSTPVWSQCSGQEMHNSGLSWWSTNIYNYCPTIASWDTGQLLWVPSLSHCIAEFLATFVST